MFFVLPSAVNSAAQLFVDGRPGAILLGIALLLLVPFPLIFVMGWYLYKAIVRPNPTLRRVYYEKNERKLTKKEHWFFRFIVYPILGPPKLSGEWKAEGTDEAAATTLARHGLYLDAIRGPRVARVGATFEVNPLTQRVDRGYFKSNVNEMKVAGVRIGKYRPFTRHFLNLKMTCFALAMGCFGTGQPYQQLGCLLVICCASCM